MLGIVLYVVAAGLYSARSDYYPEPTSPFSYLFAGWGVLLGLMLLLAWARPSRMVLWSMACVAAIPAGLVLLGHIWSAFRFGWAFAASDIAITSAFCVLLAAAYASLVKAVARSPQG
jgi:hypothetical protein